MISMALMGTRQALRGLAALVLALGVIAPMWGTHPVHAQTALPAIAAAVPESAVIVHWTDLDRDGTQWQQTESLLARVGFPESLGLWDEDLLAEGV